MISGKRARIVAIIMVCVLLDVALHVVTSEYSTMPENPDYSLVAKSLGIEVAASLWALLAFSGAAYVFFQTRNAIPGKGMEKGLRYGLSIALLWLFAMLEGAPLFGNPVISEFVVGLSDAIPVFVLGVLLGLLSIENGESIAVEPLALRDLIKAVSVFTGIFLLGRYVAYFAGVIQSGHQTGPLYTLLWTILMGACIGIICVLLGSTRNALSLELRAVKFGFFIFGVNWATFLIFMPLSFSGYLVDVLSRIAIDALLVTIGYYLTFHPRTSPLQ